MGCAVPLLLGGWDELHRWVGEVAFSDSDDLDDAVALYTVVTVMVVTVLRPLAGAATSSCPWHWQISDRARAAVRDSESLSCAIMTQSDSDASSTVTACGYHC